VGDSFVETLEIHVHVETPETFNLTLVDLPGLLALSPCPRNGTPRSVLQLMPQY
jgi:hypothetical protein